jgi:hypothetical protein
MTESATFYLQYPFRHTFADAQLVSPSLPSATGWSHWYGRLTTESFAVAVDHSYSFIPPLRAMLSPELIGRDREEIVSSGLPTAGDIPGVRAAMVPATAVATWSKQYGYRALRLTWLRDSLWLHRSLTLEIREPQGSRQSEFTIDWVDVLLFPDHVGMLMVRVQPQIDSMDETAELARYIKKIAYRRRLTVDLPTIRQTDGAQTSWADILKIVLADLTSGSPLESVTTSSHGVNWDLAVIAGVAASRDIEPFESRLEHAAFCIATGRASSKLANTPTPSQLKTLREQQTVHIWSSWLALYHYDNLTFTVDTSNERLTAEFQSHRENFEQEYVMLFAVALAQQSALDLLSTDIASIPPSVNVAQAKLSQLEDDIARFNTRFLFDQVGTTPVGVPLYAMLAKSLRLNQYHVQVYADADRLRSHLDAKQLRRQAENTRRSETLLQFLTIVALPLTVIVTLLAPRLIEVSTLKNRSPTELWEATGAFVLILVVIWWIAHTRKVGKDDEF